MHHPAVRRRFVPLVEPIVAQHLRHPQSITGEHPAAPMPCAARCCAVLRLAQRTGAVRVRTGPNDSAMRQARVCYDHLAGESGVALFTQFRHRDWLRQGEGRALLFTPTGKQPSPRSS